MYITLQVCNIDCRHVIFILFKYVGDKGFTMIVVLNLQTVQDLFIAFILNLSSYENLIEKTISQIFSLLVLTMQQQQNEREREKEKKKPTKCV